MSVKSVDYGFGISTRPAQGPTYDEEAFRYLLDTERRRAERSGRPILLLLVSVKQRDRMNASFPSAVAESIFNSLWLSVREVDFVGWFREGRVAGVVLTQGADPLVPEAPSRLGQRIAGVLRKQVPSKIADHVHVRVLQLQPRKKSPTISI